MTAGGQRDGPPKVESLGSRDVGRSLPAGVLDAGMASLATFSTGLVAANILSRSELGVYGVFFAAFMLGQMISNQLIYAPAEIAAVREPVHVRVGVLRDSLLLGIGPATVGVLAILIALFIAARVGDTDLVFALTLTAALTTFFWPTQDHVRRMLHISGRSWRAVGVSSIHLTVTLLSLGVMHIADVPVAWVPFGSLAIANIISLAAGIMLSGTLWRDPAAPVTRLEFMSLVRAGRWFLIGAGMPTAMIFVAVAVMTALAGAEAVGHAEAARIIAQPVGVLGTGLAAVLSPRAMEAAAARDSASASHPRRLFVGLNVGAGLVYMVIAGLPWALNPMRLLVPAAYDVEWLALASIAATLISILLAIVVSELAAARGELTIARISTAATPFSLAAAATAGFSGAFALPLSRAVGSVVRIAAMARALRRYYAHPTTIEATHRT